MTTLPKPPNLPIPGTTLFDGRQARKGYALNKMCFSFNDEANRKAFLADEEAYMKQYGLNEQQAAAIRAKNVLQLIAAGGKIPVEIASAIPEPPARLRITHARRHNHGRRLGSLLSLRVRNARAVLSKLSTFMPKPVDHAIRTSFRQVDQSARPLQPIPSNTQQSGLRTDRPEKPDAFGTSKFQHFQKPLPLSILVSPEIDAKNQYRVLFRGFQPNPK